MCKYIYNYVYIVGARPLEGRGFLWSTVYHGSNLDIDQSITKIMSQQKQCCVDFMCCVKPGIQKSLTHISAFCLASWNDEYCAVHHLLTNFSRFMWHDRSSTVTLATSQCVVELARSKPWNSSIKSCIPHQGSHIVRSTEWKTNPFCRDLCFCSYPTMIIFGLGLYSYLTQCWLGIHWIYGWNSYLPWNANHWDL